MKFKSKFFLRITSSFIFFMTMLFSFSFLFSIENKILSFNQDKSLADYIGIEDDEEVQVIVQFSLPSLLELDFVVGSSDALKYEQQLLISQDEILKELDIEPDFRYTNVINGVAITANAKEIRQLEKMNGVKDVYLSETFKTQVYEEHYDNTLLLPEMMGIKNALSNNYTGDGVLVAVLDSGVTFEHEAFNNTKYVQNPALTLEDITKLGYSAQSNYYNAKIPFYFDYVGFNSEIVDERGHGSHVAGIIAGYAENEDGSVKFSGIAPGAQICSMRVLDENGSGSDQTIIAALEDAYKLGVDIVNISFGRDSSFRLGGDAYVSYDNIYGNLEKAGVVVVCSIGNLGSMALNTPRFVLDENCVDYGTLSLPAIYPGNIGVGSINGSFYNTLFLIINGEKYIYTDNQDSSSDLNFKKSLNGKSVEIVYNDNYGKQEDYIGIDVKGKVVAVKRGELSFTDKCKYATDAGAIGLIVINGSSDSMGGMVIDNQSIPAILVENSVLNHLPISSYVVNFDYGLIEMEDGGELSYFSAIGVTPDLEIGLDILGVGGKVYSVMSNTKDQYITFSGTSMAAPTITGTYAVLYQVFKETYANKEHSRVDITNYMEDVTQSTAQILTNDTGNKYSPRFQGAGFIDFEKAITTKAYISTPLVCLGYDKEASGRISVQYELINVSSDDINYQAVVSAIVDDYIQITPTDYKNNVSPRMLDSSLYSYNLYVDGVKIANDAYIILPAEESITVKVELALSENILSKLDVAFPYGYFLDGFVEFNDVNDLTEPAIHGGYVSFVGDWLLAPALEPLTQIEIMDWIDSNDADIDQFLPYFAANHINANYSYLVMFLGNEEDYIGKNPLNDDYTPSFDDRNAISAVISNADEIIYDSLYISPSLLRSCKEIRYVVSNSETKEIYFNKTESYVTKDIPYDDYKFIGLSSFEFDASYVTQNEYGQDIEQYIPSGTNITISIYTTLDHPDATERLEAEYSMTIDYTAPKLYYDYNAQTKALTIKCNDSEYLAGILLKEVDDSNNIGSKYDSRIFADTIPGVEHVEVFDLSNYEGNNISITISDYASNIVSMILSLESGNISNMESIITTTDDINIEFLDTPYYYQDVEFIVTPKDGYCFSDHFALFVNGEKLIPSSIIEGVYYYTISITEEEIDITSEGVMAHSFVSTVVKEATCISEGIISTICENCGIIDETNQIPANGHQTGEPVVIKEATFNEPGISVIKCDTCGVILEENIIPAINDANNEILFGCVFIGYLFITIAVACLFLYFYKKRRN